ncbi:phage baseplate protein [Actinoallomurus acaciae]|uniref:P68 RBP/TagC-like beta-propeller domain-containing protein n=1 Tax=Actinoallomurus acaciae TaxID=502577 RepID=A0ABV5YIR2_9ACTN
MIVRHPSRRAVLRGGLIATIGAIPLVGATAARAHVADSEQFVLDGAGGNPILKKSLHANWVMQSFAYDGTNGHVYFTQSNPDSTNGDIWITQTDLAGNETGAMALHGFGHGVAIAAEPYNGAVYLWTEWEASASGFGTKIGRFPFANGTSLEADDGSIQDRTPSIGETMINPQPAIDPVSGHLLVRYKVAADMPRIVAFDLSDARAGRLTTDDRLTERALPSRGSWGDANPFQGYTAYGRYAYLLEGPVSTTSYITTIDLNDTGQSIVVDRYPTTAGQSLPGREPQGMAIWATSSGPRLAFGFHSNTGGVRQASVFYKSDLT